LRRDGLQAKLVFVVILSAIVAEAAYDSSVIDKACGSPRTWEVLFLDSSLFIASFL